MRFAAKKVIMIYVPHNGQPAGRGPSHQPDEICFHAT
jgi:hypothetical protein